MSAPERPRGRIRTSGRRGGSRALDSVVSVRADATLLAQVRGLADRDGVSLSDWFRDAARRKMENARVHVDFNDLDGRGCLFVLQAGADRVLHAGDTVTLYDLGGNTARGTMTGPVTGGMAVEMAAGSWRPTWAPKQAGWTCQHVTMTGAHMAKGTCGMGCEMQPYYGTSNSTAAA